MITKLIPLWQKLIPISIFQANAVTLDDIPVNAEDLILAIRKSELFCNMRESVIQSMLKCMRIHDVKKGDYIMRQGALENSFLLLVSGHAEVIKRKDGERASQSLAQLSFLLIHQRQSGFGLEMQTNDLTESLPITVSRH